jgi:hypothetical protein
MPKKPPSPKRPAAEQLIFPFQLRVGDVVLGDGARAEIVGPPTTTGQGTGKTTRARVRHEGETVQREGVWEAWRKVRVVRRVA